MNKPIEIRHRWTNSCLWAGEIEASGADRIDLGRAVLAARKAGANLRGAYLRGAYLRGAYLQEADLQEAYLRGADLRGAYLQEADLQGAYLQGADLRGAKDAGLAIARTRILPEGSLIGWKKCEDSRIVKLRIPEDAKRSHAFGRKCRAERAGVVAIFGPDGSLCDMATASYDRGFVYRVGETVVPKNGFSEDWQSECEAGIHFYITREEAEAH